MPKVVLLGRIGHDRHGLSVAQAGRRLSVTQAGHGLSVNCPGTIALLLHQCHSTSVENLMPQMHAIGQIHSVHEHHMCHDCLLILPALEMAPRNLARSQRVPAEYHEFFRDFPKRLLHSNAIRLVVASVVSLASPIAITTP